MLQDEPREYIEEQFNEKNSILAAYGEQVSAFTFYEDMFCLDTLDTVFPVVIIGEDEKKHIVQMPLDLAIEQAAGRNDMLMGACTYFHNWISKKSARDIYGFIIDADNFYSGTLQNAMMNNWRTASNEDMPMPTYIVNSGTGLHLYYLFDEPIPNYKGSTGAIDKIYRALAIQQTTKRVYLHKQVQWFGQDFRMAGGLNKYGWTNSIYKVGPKWDIDELAIAVGIDAIHIRRYDEPRKEKKASKRRKKPRRQGWRSNEKFYSYALKECKSKTKEGNRYTSMCALTVIAWKCAIPIERLECDLKSLLPIYNKGAKRIVKESEIQSALKMYNDRAMMTQRATLEDWQGWDYTPIKRNGNKRAEHLEEARAIRDIRSKRRGEAWDARSGRKPALKTVSDWRTANPEGTKAECIRATGLDKKTVYKWWDGEIDKGIKDKRLSKNNILHEQWQVLYDSMKSMQGTIQAMDALIAALPDGEQKERAKEVRERTKNSYDILVKEVNAD